jgi:tRNA U34 5-methylaminomethyl-2-thiouridine-forming methyltransferase MnmC
MEILLTQDGSPTILNNELGVTYHSRYGAITESNHVFIDNGLAYLDSGDYPIHILEIGFGTGLNSFLTFFRRKNIVYHAIEPFPLSSSIYDVLDYYKFISDNPAAHQVYKKITEQKWNESIQVSDQFILIKFNVTLQEIALPEKYHLIYFDAFAPSAQPELWSEEMLKKVYESLTPNGILVTYCAKGSVKRIFKQLGAIVHSPPGPPGKREMTRIIKP